jgi:hypothetical protein
VSVRPRRTRARRETGGLRSFTDPIGKHHFSIGGLYGGWQNLLRDKVPPNQ